MQRSTSSKRPRKQGLARSALAFLLVLIMLAAQAVGYLPAPARAETGAQTFSLDESGLMIKLTSATGATSYCGEAPKMAPSGYTYSTWYYTGLAPDGTFTCDRHALAWLISQGYPFTTTPGGFTCDDPADVTQMAIWMLLGQIDERGWSADGEIKYDYTGNRNYITTADLQRAWQFSRTALEHAGEEGSWDTLSKWWVAPTGVIQSVVECQPVPKQGGIEIWKGSSNPGLTSGNRAYSLEGAVYGIYRDEACQDLVDKMTTDAEGHATYEPLDLGTYWLKELEPPKNHKRDETVHRVEVNGEGVNTRVDLTDEPLYAAAHFYVQKVDTNGAGTDIGSQGDASLAGAQFTVRFYEDIKASSEKELPESPDRTWVIETVDYAGYGVARLHQDFLVEGSDPFYGTDPSSGNALLPPGTFTVQETKAPYGYRAEDASLHFAQVEVSADNPESCVIKKVGTWSSVFGNIDEYGFAVENRVITGGISVPKIDHKLRGGVAQGDATLEGAVIGIFNASGRPVKIEGESIGSDELVTTIETNDEGIAATGNHDLPVGTYRLKELEPPEGYLLNDEWSSIVSVQNDGEIIPASEDQALEETVISGSGSVQKADAELADTVAQGDATLAGAEVAIINRSEGPVSVGGVTYQPNQRIDTATLVTDEGGWATTKAKELPYGTYEAIEIKAPEGYKTNDGWSQVFKIREDGQAVELHLADEPIRGGISIEKVDAETGLAEPQGSATLEGAVFSIINRSVSGVMIEGSWREPGETVMTIETDERGRASTGERDLPYGTYEVVETKAPKGYAVNESWSEIVQIRADGLVVPAGTEPVCDPVGRGGIDVQKVDRELADSGSENPAQALGAATIEGAVLDIYNRSERPIKVGETVFEKDAKVMSIVTDEQGFATTGERALPVGTYEVVEADAPEGYRTDVEWSRVVSLENDGDMAHLTSNADHLKEQVFRGDLSFEKSLDGGARLAGIPFRITSETTGEWHVIATDDNGMASTSAEWNAHTTSTNKNDAAVLADGTADDSKLNSGAGVWFSGITGESTEADDALGALPYDWYCVEELRCGANEGMTLVSTRVHVTRDGVTLELGTFDDTETRIDTSLSYAGGSSKSVPAREGIELSDTVRYEGITPGTEYLLVGELHAVSAEGADMGVVAETSTTVRESVSSGEADVTFTVDTTELAGMRLVAFEHLYDGDRLVASHAALDDEGQTVYVPGIRTELTSDATSDHEAPSWADSALTDTVTLVGLVPGETYTVTDTLHLRGGDGSDEGPIKDAGGNELTASRTFEATERTMTVQLEFDAPTSLLAGRTVVAMAKLSNGQGELAAHEEIADERQSVRMPSVVTEAISEATGDHQSPQDEAQVIVDTVSLSNLTVGRTYIVSGELHMRSVDGSDAGTLLDASGAPVTATLTFEAEEPDMQVELRFEGVDTSSLGERDLVVFEELSRDGMLLATHADIADENQTVHVPELETTSTAEATGNHGLPTHSEQVIIDVVHATNLIVGKEYEVTGTLHLQSISEDGTVSDGGELTDENGTPISASTSFVATDATMDVELRFTVDATPLQGQSVVAFEELSSEGVRLVVHADIHDQEQTVHAPSVRTSARAATTGERCLPAKDGQVIVDTVELQNLVAGTEYTLRGSAHLISWDESGNPLDEGTLAEVERTFTAESRNQIADVELSVDAAELDGRSIVIFEELWDDDVLLARHADLADAEQTVTVPDMRTTALDAADGNDELAAAPEQTVVDTVELTGLIPGRSYEVTGTLHVKSWDEEGHSIDDGALLDAEGNEVSARTSFVAEATEQCVELSFTVDARSLQGRDLVAFEELSSEGVELATHADIDDEEQTVHVPGIATTLAGSETGAKELQAAQDEDGSAPIRLTDTVDYANLRVGETYELVGTLHRRETAEDGTVSDGGALLDKDGEPISATAELVPDEPNGSVEVTFSFDASDLGGCAIVAFEELRRDGVLLATHADVSDEGQTVRLVDLSTSAVDKTDGDHGILAAEGAAIVDTVSYEGLRPGASYTLTGSLHLVGDEGEDAGELVDAGGSVIQGAVTFVPEAPSGEVQVNLVLDATGLEGRTAVVFEELTREGRLVAMHADITDEAQSVSFEAPPEEDEPEEPNEDIPETGESVQPIAALGAGGAALSAMAAVLAARRRRR